MLISRRQEKTMTVRHSLRWETKLQDPGELLTADERDERTTLAWTVFLLLIAGIVTTGVAVWGWLI